MASVLRSILGADDYKLAYHMIGEHGGQALREPDLIIAPDGNNYLYRWHLTPHEHCKDFGQNFFHVQVSSDPERPLHDHPWDNFSVILSGGYDEAWEPQPWLRNECYRLGDPPQRRMLRKGDTVSRRASEAHRLFLPDGIDYTMTLFSVGPVLRPWGFWFEDGWHPASEVTRLDPVTRKSVHIGRKETP